MTVHEARDELKCEAQQRVRDPNTHIPDILQDFSAVPALIAPRKPPSNLRARRKVGMSLVLFIPSRQLLCWHGTSGLFHERKWARDTSGQLKA